MKRGDVNIHTGGGGGGLDAITGFYATQAARKEITDAVAEIMAHDPQSVITGAKISARSWWNHKLYGTFLIVGVLCTPFILLGLLRGLLFPQPLQPTANSNVRAGHVLGSFIHTNFWEPVGAPGIAAAEASFRVQEVRALQGAGARSVPAGGFGNTSSLPAGIPNSRTTLVTNVSGGFNGTGLSDGEIHMLQQFAGRK